MASKQFTKVLAKRKDAHKLMQAAKEAEKNDFSMPTVNGEHLDGVYVAKIKAKLGITPNKGIPFVSLKWVVLEGEAKGKAWQQDYYLDQDDKERELKTWAALGNAIKTLSTRDDIDSWEIEDLQDIVEEITDDVPTCRINVRYWKGKKSEGYSCYFNERVEDVGISVDDYVIYDGGNGPSEYIVDSINPRKQTADIVTEDGDDTFNSVSIKDLELANA